MVCHKYGSGLDGGSGLGVNTRLLWTELIGQRMFASVDSIMNNLFEMIKLVVQMCVCSRRAVQAGNGCAQRSRVQGNGGRRAQHRQK